MRLACAEEGNVNFYSKAPAAPATSRPALKAVTSLRSEKASAIERTTNPSGGIWGMIVCQRLILCY